MISKGVPCPEKDFLDKTRTPGRGNGICQDLEVYLLSRKQHLQALEPGRRVWQEGSRLTYELTNTASYGVLMLCRNQGARKVRRAKERHAQYHSPMYPNGLPSRCHSLFQGPQRLSVGTLSWKRGGLSPRVKRLRPSHLKVSPALHPPKANSQRGWRSWPHARTRWAGISCGRGLGGS